MNSVEMKNKIKSIKEQERNGNKPDYMDLIDLIEYLSNRVTHLENEIRILKGPSKGLKKVA